MMIWIIVSILLLLAALYAVFTLFCAKKAVSKCRKLEPLDEGRPLPSYMRKSEKAFRTGLGWLKTVQDRTEWLTLTSRDGLKLRAQLIPCDDPKRTLLLFHGYHSHPYFDYCAVLRYYHEHGSRILLVHERAHGESEGMYTVFGEAERYDCADWAWKARELFGEEHPIYLEGLSMGASAVVMAGDLKLPDNVRGIVADCGFTDAETIIARTAKNRFHVPPALVMPGMKFWFRRLTGHAINEASTVKSAASSDLPLLLIHGEADDFVPCEMSVQTFRAAASADKTLVTVPGAGHGLSFIVDPERVMREMDAFFERTGS